MIRIVKEYQKLIDKLPQLLEDTPYKTQYIISEIGVTKPTFYRKLKQGSWTPTEVIKLLKFINPEEYYRYEFEQELNQAEDDLQNGDIVSNEIALKRIKKRLTK